jgi:hypothetical protein
MEGSGERTLLNPRRKSYAINELVCSFVKSSWVLLRDTLIHCHYGCAGTAGISKVTGTKQFDSDQRHTICYVGQHKSASAIEINTWSAINGHGPDVVDLNLLMRRRVHSGEQRFYLSNEGRLVLPRVDLYVRTIPVIAELSRVARIGPTPLGVVSNVIAPAMPSSGWRATGDHHL